MWGRLSSLSKRQTGKSAPLSPQNIEKIPKRDRIKVDREQVLTVDPAQLPADAEFKGYEDVVVQYHLKQWG